MNHMPLIDVMVGHACELRCRSCTNGIGLLPMTLFPVTAIERDIELAASVLHADVAVVLGGEPLMHPDLLRLMRSTRDSGIADSVRVLTNGIRLHRMPGEFWSELEDLRISIYPGETPAGNVALARERSQEHGFALSFYDVVNDPFRAVHTREARTDASAQETWLGCWYRSNTRKIEAGHFWRCCTSPHISQAILGLAPDVDGLPLDGITEESLEAFLARDTFMESCRRCHGNTGPQIAWSEERDKTRWLEASVR